ncbi:MAG: hypothetical protein HY540_06045 [Deltaproteobacteria bacterium]|nr:hypothetical protein [Deltaproteobacteria bacterium]
MKTYTRTLTRILLSVVATFSLIACSDGEIQFGEAAKSISPPKPGIISFEATPDKITSGGETVLSWKVAGADRLTIEAKSETGAYQFKSDSLTDAEGKLTVDGITETTDFVLTAVKSITPAKPAEGTQKLSLAVPTPQPVNPLPPVGGIPPPPASTSKNELVSTAVVRVTVTPGGNIVVRMEAVPSEIAPGEQSVIKWEVVDAMEGMTVTLTSDAGDAAMSSYTSCEGTPDEIRYGEEAETVPTVGCAVVEPSIDTIYTVTVKNKNGREGSASVTVNVVEEAFSATLTLNGSESDIEVDAGVVTLAWTVSSREGVTIALRAEGSVDQNCSEALGRITSMEDAQSVQCTVLGETKFTIEATKGEATAQDTITARLKVSADIDLKFDGPTWAFSGERVQIQIKPKEEGMVGSIGQVIIRGAQDKVIESIPASGVTEEVTAPVIVELRGRNGMVKTYHPIAVLGSDVKPLEADLGETAVTRVAIDATNARMYRGVMRDGIQDGKVFFYAGNERRHIDIKTAINGDKNGVGRLAPEGISDAFFNTVKDYPITTIAVREGKADEIYVGTTGVLFRSTDGGKTFKQMVWFPRFKNGVYKDSYATCAGKLQPGTKIDEVVSLGQACDVIAEASGRVLIATDVGVYTVRNIDQYDDPAKAEFVGAPAEGEKASVKGYLTYLAQAHDLEKVDSTYYAATSRGVFKSADGEKWEKVGELSAAFALSYDADAKMLYAGTANGISAISMTGGAWSSKGNPGGTVLSLAVDKYSPLASRTIIAGTSTGAYVSRNGGSSFMTINGVEGEARSVALVAMPMVGLCEGCTNNQIQYGLMIGSAKGTMSGGAIVELTPVTTLPADMPAEATE